jgi:hypothetical protein
LRGHQVFHVFAETGLDAGRQTGELEVDLFELLGQEVGGVHLHAPL